MASIRRTLSPVPRPGSRSNGEACSVASPLSKSSSAEKNPLQPSGLSYSSYKSLEYALYRVHNFVLGLFSHRSSRSLDRSKSKGHVWKRAILHFSVFFLVGVFIGLTPFGTSNFPGRIMPQHQTLFFDMIPSAVRYHSVSARNVSSIDETRMENHTSTGGTQDIENATSHEQHQELKVQMERMASETLTVKPVIENPPLEVRKLLIVVTPTYPRPFQAYYLNRLAQTLKLVPPPLVWIVIEMNSQSAETTQILRKTGLMYRHLVCNKNITDVRDRYVHQRNVALAHIETHRLDGIVYFADDVNVYSLDLFVELRQIRRFGTWKLAKLSVIRGATFHDGPVCNGSQIIGWKTDEMTRRFHADSSGFAFNSTILWDPKRWHRPILEPIRQLDTVEEKFQVGFLNFLCNLVLAKCAISILLAGRIRFSNCTVLCLQEYLTLISIIMVSTFIEQVVEDESQMEGLLGNCLSIMVWRLPLESSSSSYPHQWVISRNVDKQLTTK